MKKMFFLAATAALALSSCSSDELVQAEQPVVEDGAVVFSAYTGRANRAVTIDDKELAEHGFGVFAYEQGPALWSTYSTGNTYPNFMYNQKVGKKVKTDCSYAFDDSKNITTLAKYASAPAYIKGLYEDAKVAVKEASTEFTDAQMNALIALGLADSGSDWTKSADHNKYTGDKTITYEQYDALSGILWANKGKLFTVKGSGTDGALKVPETKLNYNDYCALSAAEQFYFEYTEPEFEDGADWDYTPKKYYSNNDEAKHSFFAYAPYQKDVKAVFTDNGPAIRYNAADDYDLLWGAKVTNRTTSPTPSVTDNGLAWIDMVKPSITGEVDFQFHHALTKVSLDATYFVDKKHTDTEHSDSYANNEDDAKAPNFLDENTTVVIRSVKFIGQVPSQGLLSLYDGSWTYEKIEESACEVMTGTTFIWDGTADKSGDYKPLKNDMTIIPTQAGDKVQIQIVYDVITTDLENPKNNSKVTNTRTSGEYELLAGHDYKFHIDLGLTSVKFNASVKKWEDTEEKYVDLPNNKQ